MSVHQFVQFLKKSPSSYHAISNVYDLLKTKANFSSKNETLKKGRCYVFTKESKNGAALVAVDIGANADLKSSFHIVGSHSDSPWFKIIYDGFESEHLNLLSCTPYGGLIKSTWYDRPLTIAGRVKIKENGEEFYRLVHILTKTFIIPNCCGHFAKFLDDQKLLLEGDAIIGTKSKLKEVLRDELGLKSVDSIKDFDLNLINKDEPVIWGDDNEFVSGGREDNLASVYTSALAFRNSYNKDAINVLYIPDNEEIGSDTDVGAKKLFLNECLAKVIKDIKLDEEMTLKRSFMISSDNAQGCHPYFSYLYNPDFKVYMNKGFAIKYSERYSTTEESATRFKNFCLSKNLPFQEYKNRKDIPGGGTIGKIVQTHLPIESVDIGLAQLAMHSSYETMGAKDIEIAEETFKCFFNFFI